MPIYEYSCAKCGETIEAIQQFSDPPLTKHEGCGGKLSKLLSVPSFRVKENDGLTSRTHPSILQQAENERKAKDKKEETG